jgi:hypothetical protein
MLCAIMQSVITQSDTKHYRCHYAGNADCNYSECHYAECYYDERHNADCHYADFDYNKMSQLAYSSSYGDTF